MNNLNHSRILEVEERFRQAMLQNDRQVLDELISPDLLFTGLNGQLVSKEEDLASHQAGLLRPTIFETIQQDIQMHPEFAVVSALMHLVGSYAGQSIDQHLRYTRVWALNGDGSLQITAGHMSEVL